MTYDNAGNLTNDTYSGQGQRNYDAENRMTQAWANSQWQTYTYDANGQRVKRSININGTQTETWQVYGVNGELLAEYAANASASSPQKEYGYRNGQLLVEIMAAGGSGWGSPPTFTDNPLAAGVVVKALHITELRTAINDLRGHLNKGTYPWQYSATTNDWISANPILEMRTALDDALGVPTPAYSAGLAQGQPIKAIHIQELRDRVTAAWGSGSGGVDIRWLVADQLGTPRIILDKTGALANVKRHDYLPFGEELFAGQGGRTAPQGYVADGIRQQFTSKERDNETGLDYFNARYYASTQGRFTSPDPLVASGKAAIPQSWNRYTYCLDNPLKFIDPSGMMWIYHYLDKKHEQIGIAWIDGDQISKADKAQGYQSLNFGGEKSRDITLTSGSVVRLNATSGHPLELRGPQQSARDGGYVNTGLLRELGRQTAPIPKATGLFVLASLNGGYAIAGSSIALADAAAYTLYTAHEMGQSEERSPGEVVAGTRADEYPAGQINEANFPDAAMKYLGPGYKELSPGRYVSSDGMRQVRFGDHETRGPGLHGHFEAYDMTGGRVVENSVLKIVP